VIVTSVLRTPIGDLSLAAEEDGTLTGIGLPGTAPPAGVRRSDRTLAPICDQLRRYFAGELRDWDLRRAEVGTPFQRDVWAGLQRIPYGETRSYGQLAGSVGRPGAARAVGAANRANPYPVIVPCHRVIGADGSLTGYAGRTALDIKRQLLDLEAGALTFAL
jgi:methylated-DNA-[protein]-cysteine S-methyltransferase